MSSITGSAVVGGTITAGDITGDPDGMSSNPNITYQWQVASNNVWTDLTNTGSETRDYVPLAEHVNKSLRVKVTYTDAIGTRGYVYSDPVNIYVPDSTAPTLTNSQVSTDGSKLILTFSKNISWSQGDAFSFLQVTVDGSTNNPVTAVNTTKTVLKATLSDKILSGQQITFDYLSSAQIIQDSNGNSTLDKDDSILLEHNYLNEYADFGGLPEGGGKSSLYQFENNYYLNLVSYNSIDYQTAYFTSENSLDVYKIIHTSNKIEANLFETEIDGISVNGVDMIQWDDDGKILNFKVMIRPFKAVEIVRAKMVEALEQI